MVTSVDVEPNNHNTQEPPAGLATQVGGRYASERSLLNCNKCGFYLAHCDTCQNSVPKVGSHFGRSGKHRMRQPHSSRGIGMTALSTVYSIPVAHSEQPSKVESMVVLPPTDTGGKTLEPVCIGVSNDGGANPQGRLSTSTGGKTFVPVCTSDSNLLVMGKIPKRIHNAAVELTSEDYLRNMRGKVLVIIDSGASEHMFNDESFFRFIVVPEYVEFVTFANGDRTTVGGRGDTCLVKDALYVPRMALNVISVSKLDEAGYMIIFADGAARVLYDDEEVMSGTLSKKVYVLDTEYILRLLESSCDNYQGAVNPLMAQEADIMDSIGDLSSERSEEPSEFTYESDEFLSPSPHSSDPAFDDEDTNYSERTWKSWNTADLSEDAQEQLMKERADERRENRSERSYSRESSVHSWSPDESTDSGFPGQRGRKRARNAVVVGGAWRPSAKHEQLYEIESERNYNKLMRTKWSGAMSVQTRGQLTRGEKEKPEVKRKKAGRQRPTRKVRFAADIAENPLWRLHLEMGHLHPARILKGFKEKVIQDSRYKYEDLAKYAKVFPTCPDCLAGSMRALPVPKETSPTEYKVLEKIAVDYKGPFKTKARGGYTGFYLFSDQASDFMWSYAVRSKSELLNALKSFWTEVVETHSHLHSTNPVRVWQSDYNKEQLDASVEEWTASKGSKLRASPPYKHDKNGQIERDMQSILDKARTVMAAYNCTTSWWYRAVRYSIYSLNRSPTTKADVRTPWERLTGKKPKISHMVPFFCPGFYHISKEEVGGSRSNWEAKAKPCRMIGYDDFVEEGYTLYDLDSMQEVDGREDVIFDSTLVQKYVQGMKSLVDNPVVDADEDPLDVKVTPDSEFFNIVNYSYVIETRGDKLQEVVFNAEKLCHESIAEKYVINHCREDVLDEMIHQVASVNLIDKTLMLPTPPKTISEALMASNPQREIWEEAIENELKQFDEYKIFERGVDQNGHAMKTKFVFTVGYRSDFTIKYKARLVVCGYSQIKGLDYEETFAPTAPIVSIFMVLRTAAVLDFEFAVCDVTAAFFEGEAEFDQFCLLPKEVSSTTTGKPERVKIIGNMYGEKQAPKVWNDKAHEIITGFGFTRCPWDPCIYWLIEGLSIVFMIAIHVDDMLLLSKSKTHIKQFYDYLLTKVRKVALFEPNDASEIKYIGMVIRKVYRDSSIHFELSQEEYIKKMDLFQGEDLKGKIPIVPMPSHVNLRMEAPNPDNPSLLPVTGTLRYVCDRTRPDVLLTTGEISTGGSGGPSDMHVKVAKQVYKYLKNTPKLALRLGGDRIQRNIGILGRVLHFFMTDATYVTIGKSKSRLAHCGWIGYSNGAYTSMSVNDTTVSLSSMESEVKALSLCCMNVVSSRRMLKSLGYKQGSTYVFVDNKAAIDLAKTLKTTPKSKHIQPRINYIRERVNAGDIQILFVPSRFNVADMLTKAVPPEVHADHTDKLLNGFSTIDPLMREIVTLDYVIARV